MRFGAATGLTAAAGFRGGCLFSPGGRLTGAIVVDVEARALKVQTKTSARTALQCQLRALGTLPQWLCCDLLGDF